MIQGGGEKEEPIVLWKHRLDAPQTASGKTTDPFRFCQFWRELLFASKPSYPSNKPSQDSLILAGLQVLTEVFLHYSGTGTTGWFQISPDWNPIYPYPELSK